MLFAHHLLFGLCTATSTFCALRGNNGDMTSHHSHRSSSSRFKRRSHGVRRCMRVTARGNNQTRRMQSNTLNKQMAGFTCAAPWGVVKTTTNTDRKLGHRKQIERKRQRPNRLAATRHCA